MEILISDDLIEGWSEEALEAHISLLDQEICRVHRLINSFARHPMTPDQRHELEYRLDRLMRQHEHALSVLNDTRRWRF